MGSVDEHLRRWREAGLIDAALDARIAGFEAARARAEPSRPGLIEVLIYLGVAVIGAGVIALIGPAWDDLGSAARISVPSAAGLGALIAGFVLRRIEGAAPVRQAQVAWLGANALLPIAGGIAAYEAGASDFDAALGGAASALALAVVFWLATRGPTQLFALAATLVALAFALGARSDEVPLAIAGGLSFAAGVAGVVLVERRLMGPLELGRGLAALLLLGGAYFAGLDERDSAYEAIVHVAGVALIVLGLRTGSFVQLAFAVVAIFIGLNTTIFRHTDNPTLAAGALIGLGIVLIAWLIAFQIFRRRVPAA